MFIIDYIKTFHTKSIVKAWNGSDAQCNIFVFVCTCV